MLSLGRRIALVAAGLMTMRTTIRRSCFPAALLLFSAAAFAQYQSPTQFPGPGPQGAPPQAPPQSAMTPPQPVTDEPGQPVARLSLINGDASVLRGDSGEWTAAVVNAPLMAGDSVAVPAGSHVELQLDNANFLRADGNTEFRLAAFDPARVQVQLSRGLVTWRFLRQSGLQVELSTPSIAVHPFPFSAVRVEVSPDGSTRAVVRHGEADISGQRGTERVREGNMATANEADFQVAYAAPPDAWDNWNEQRDGGLSRAQSGRYVSPDIYGTEDLDAAGRWGYDSAYGNVWTPDVPAGWAPYRDGQWVWSPYYGWTWVDNAPWGWAPYHYGSWYFRAGFGWSWFPGSRFGHYWYRPAMVSFFGFGANIGWVPLAPYEPFRPWYGRGYRPGIGVGFAVGSFHNAAFAVGLTVADFQRGAFRNHFVVNRVQLQQASIVQGTHPVVPTLSTRRFSAATPIPGRNTFASQRFYSPGASPVARPAAPPASNWQRFGQTPAASAPPGARGGAAWDRFGAPQRPGPQAMMPGQQAPQRQFQVAPPIVHQREAAPSFSRPAPPQGGPGGHPQGRPEGHPQGHPGGGRGHGGEHH